MKQKIPGIHHITAIAGDPQGNVDFYNGFLGLRLVKKTVNFDDPQTYHLYYGDEEGHPGTILTFFPWPGAHHGSRGAGQLTTVSFSVPEWSLGWWIDRFDRNGVIHESARRRFDEESVAFLDPDGLRLELVAHASAENVKPWEGGPVSSRHALRGFHGATLTETNLDHTAAFLMNILGFHKAGEVGDCHRFIAGDHPGHAVDVLHLPNESAGHVAVGTVHHIAWRTPTGDEQLEWRREIEDAGTSVTPVIDRQYFHSIYFREPGGVLFEIATDPPGFTLDEPLEELGSGLMLPPRFEHMRGELERVLPPVRMPEVSYA